MKDLDMQIEDLQLGSQYSNEQVRSTFRCSLQSGMNKSNTTNTLVLIINHIKSIYHDRWLDNKVHHIGKGQVGDQTMTRENKTLSESNKNGVKLHLFEVFRKGIYIYRGQVHLYEKPYQKEQLDKNGNPRKVWVFPLEFDEHSKPIENSEIDELFQAKFNKAQKLSNEELENKANNLPDILGFREVTSVRNQRNPYVVAYSLRRANGVCELCEQPAPFNKDNGEPYLDVHHVKLIEDGGHDMTENAVALCPNCHRMMHSLNRKSDIDILILANKKKKI